MRLVQSGADSTNHHHEELLLCSWDSFLELLYRNISTCVSTVSFIESVLIVDQCSDVVKLITDGRLDESRSSCD